MTKYTIEDTTLTNIANSIREKTGKSEKLLPSQMPNEIKSIESGGSVKYTPRYISFYGYTGTDLDYEISQLDTSLIESMYNLFFDCQKIKVLNLSNFDTSNVTNMSYMFRNCYELRELDLSSFNTEKVTNMAVMFFSCRKITTIDISSFTTNENTNTTNIFMSCGNLNKLIINNNKLFKLSNNGGINGTQIGNGTGYIYVPDDMVETYKNATNWSAYANQIKGMSELT